MTTQSLFDRKNDLRARCGLPRLARPFVPEPLAVITAPVVVHLRRCSAAGQFVRWYAAPTLDLVAAAAAGRAGLAAQRPPCPESTTATLGEP